MTLSCGCEPDASGYGYCGECCRKLRAKILKNLTPEQKKYDDDMDQMRKNQDELDDAPSDADYNSGCSCHINPPCSYCMDKTEEGNDE